MISVPCRQVDGQISLMQKEYDVIYKHTVLQDTEKTSLTLNRPTTNTYACDVFKET
jgi:hypothetical protein